MLNVQVGVFEDNKMLYCFQYQNDKKEVIKWINNIIKEFSVKQYFNPERYLMYKILPFSEKWYTLKELTESGVIKLNAKD